MTESKIVDKGGLLEEVLREYFLEQGYYALRGVRYVFGGVDVTDVDLWLYQRGSSFSRQRFNVDIKNKRVPQAIERIMWAKGVKECLRLDGVLVATTDSRPAVRQFAASNDVVLLDGTLLERLKLWHRKNNSRISEEELVQLVRSARGDRVGGELLECFECAKSRVLSQLDFDGCNALFGDIQFLVEKFLTVSHRRIGICRMLYATVSVLIIALDFIVQEFALIERSAQLEKLQEGFRYGRSGKLGADKVFSAVSKILGSFGKGGKDRGSDLLKQLREQSMDLPVDIVAEHLIRINHGSALFDLARGFDAIAYAKEFRAPSSLPPEYKAMIGVLLDFFGIERREFFDAGVGNLALAAVAGPSLSLENTPPQQELSIDYSVKKSSG